MLIATSFTPKTRVYLGEITSANTLLDISALHHLDTYLKTLSEIGSQISQIISEIGSRYVTSRYPAIHTIIQIDTQTFISIIRMEYCDRYIVVYLPPFDLLSN